jgi:hypothetical protein
MDNTESDVQTEIKWEHYFFFDKRLKKHIYVKALIYAFPYSLLHLLDGRNMNLLRFIDSFD